MAMSNRRTPAWERLMESKGLGSYRRLADRSGTSHEAVRRVVLAQPASDTSIRAVAAALSVDVELVRKMRGEAEFDPREWEPPEDPRHNLITDCGGGASKVRVATLFVLATLLATVTPSIWVGPAGLEPATHGLKVRTFG